MWQILEGGRKNKGRPPQNQRWYHVDEPARFARTTEGEEKMSSEQEREHNSEVYNNRKEGGTQAKAEQNSKLTT
jgi:hypothetical protein